jgi:hypothetical protein
LSCPQKSSTSAPRDSGILYICCANSLADNYLRGDELDMWKKSLVN